MRSIALRRIGVAALLLVSARALPAADAAAGKRLSFEEARLMIEYNATDQDIGVQLALDAESWQSLKVVDPRGRKIFDVFGHGSMGALGLSELFTESNEPSTDELPVADLLEAFPAGVYAVIGITPDGEKVSGRARLTHVIPGAPAITGPAGGPQDRANVVVSWTPVPDPAGGHIVSYQVILEHGEPVRTFSVDVPASVHSVRIAPEYLEAASTYAFEVIAWEAGGNHTISEGQFTTQ